MFDFNALNDLRMSVDKLTETMNSSAGDGGMTGVTPGGAPYSTTGGGPLSTPGYPILDGTPDLPLIPEPTPIDLIVDAAAGIPRGLRGIAVEIEQSLALELAQTIGKWLLDQGIKALPDLSDDSPDASAPDGGDEGDPVNNQQLDDPNLLIEAPPDGGSGLNEYNDAGDSTLAGFGWGAAGLASSDPSWLSPGGGDSEGVGDWGLDSGWGDDSGGADTGGDGQDAGGVAITSVGTFWQKDLYSPTTPGGSMQPAPVLHVTPEHLNLAAVQFRNAQRQITDLVGYLDSRIPQIVAYNRGTWAAKLEEAWQVWRIRILYVGNEYGNIAKLFDIASNIYRGADGVIFKQNTTTNGPYF